VTLYGVEERISMSNMKKKKMKVLKGLLQRPKTLTEAPGSFI
jgi:hypothetical protein